MVIEEEMLDQMIDYMKKLSSIHANDMSVKIGEYKGYDVRVLLHKPEEDEENNR